MLSHPFRFFVALALVVLGAFAASAQSVVAIVDSERVEREAAAHRDFALQTTEIRENIVQLRRYISRGGLFEQEMQELEQRKSIIGNDKYEEERAQKQQTFVNAQRSLQVLELTYERMREEAMVQIERARQPVIRQILSDQGVQVILYKQQLLGHASGLDVTTEFIEMLDAELPSVEIKTPFPRAADAPAEGENSGETGGN